MTNYISEGHGPRLVISCIVPLVLTWSFFFVRIYVRWIMLKMWKVEDWLFVASQISFTVLAISALMSALHGNGQKLVNLKLTDIPLAMEFFFVGELFYVLTTVFIRLSIGFYLLHICILKLHLWIIRITMAIITLLSLVYFIFAVVQCHPVGYFWGQFSGQKGSCFPAPIVQNITISYAVFAASTDMVFGILPLFVIWNLKMNRRAKIIVGGLLTLGIIAGCTVIIRIEYIRLVNIIIDFLFATSNVSIWSMIEPAIGICCMAASTFRPLFSSLKDKSSTNYDQLNGKNSGDMGGSGKGGSRGHCAHGESFRPSNIMRSGSKSGYLKSLDMRDGKMDSFEDIIDMGSFESRVEGGQKGEGSGRAYGREGENEERGIMFSTTVDIRSDLRKSRADNTVSWRIEAVNSKL